MAMMQWTLFSLSLNLSLLLCLLLLPVGIVVEAMAPPHPDWTDFESVHAMRKRLNISFPYTPLHYPAEQCRYSTEEACRQMDKEAGEAKERRQKQREREQHRRNLNPGQGTIKILVFLMYYPEHASIVSSLPPKTYYEELLNGVGTSDVNPAGSLSEYFYVNSIKQFQIQFVVQDWAQAAQSEAYYSGGAAGQDGDLMRLQSLFRDQLDALDQSGYDWSVHDSNLDGYLDGTMAIHSGVPAELGPATECGVPDYLQRLWSQAIVGSMEGGWMSSSGLYMLDGFTITGGTGRPICDTTDSTKRVYSPTNIAIAAHELGHTWGLLDFYDQSGDNLGNVGGLGSYDIMANAYGWNFNGALTSYYSAYNKMKAGWMTPSNITSDGFYPILPIEISGQAYIISDPYPPGEYLIIECRYPYRWSSDMPASGIIIYHVDDSAPGMQNRGYPGSAGWPTKHYQVAVQQKDGNYDIEQGANVGDATDFYILNDVLGPGPDTWPNTDSYQGAQKATGLTIKITTNPGLVSQFQVSGFRKWTLAAPPLLNGGSSLMAPNGGDGATTSGETVASLSSSSSSSSTLLFSAGSCWWNESMRGGILARMTTIASVSTTMMWSSIAVLGAMALIV